MANPHRITLTICGLMGLALAGISMLCMAHLADVRFLGAFLCTGFAGLAMAEICALAILEVL